MCNRLAVALSVLFLGVAMALAPSPPAGAQGGAPFIDMDIFDGQAPADAVDDVFDNLEESRGAVTVANLNDTDGDGKRDDTDVDGVVATAKGRDEVDLMKLELNVPRPSQGGNAVLRINQGGAITTPGTGRVRLWTTATKTPGTRITTQIADFGFPLGFKEFVAFPVGGIDPILGKTIWVEVVTPSVNVRDIELEWMYEPTQVWDIVKATAVWAEVTDTSTTAATCRGRTSRASRCCSSSDLAAISAYSRFRPPRAVAFAT